jgi:hypothetical protein
MGRPSADVKGGDASCGASFDEEQPVISTLPITSALLMTSTLRNRMHLMHLTHLMHLVTDNDVPCSFPDFFG